MRFTVRLRFTKIQTQPKPQTAVCLKIVAQTAILKLQPNPQKCGLGCGLVRSRPHSEQPY